MRKLISFFLIIVVIAAIALCLPYFMGILTQRKCEQLTNTFANLAHAEIKVVSYQRHWFDSDATFVVKFNYSSQSTPVLETLANKLQQQTITAHILHGPVLISPRTVQFVQALIDAAVILTPEQNALLSRGNTTVPVVTIKLKINLDGSSSLQSQIMPVNYQTDKVKVNLSGLTLQTSFSAGLDKVNAVLNLSGVEVITPDAALQVKNLVTNYDGVKNAFDLWLEQRQIACESLQLKSGVNSDLAFNGLSLQSNMTEEKRAIAMRGNFTLANGTFNGLSYTQNILEWDISNLNPEVLAKLREELRDFSNLNQPSMQQGLKIAQYLGQLLNNGLTFDIKQARTHTPWGDFMAAGQIVALPAKNADVFAVLNNLRGDFSLQMESPLAQYLLTQYYAREASAAITPAEQAKNILNNWVQSGSVVLDGNNYKTKLKYDKTFFINDKPIALSVDNETGLRQKKN